MDTDKKPWNVKQPFQRINSPSFSPPGGAPLGLLDGDGHTRGTRRPDDFVVRSALDAIAIKKLIRLTPSWTTTMGTTEADAEQEIFGKLKRSFQTWTDAPPGQWHRWYDWNFHVVPEAPFAWLRGPANTDVPEKAEPAEHSLIPFKDFIDGTIFGPARNVVPGHAMECEWDTGAISGRPGGMFGSDWSIPMTGEYVWIAGRSIYDGGHEHEPDGPNPSPGPKPLLCRSELHPCKAVASARWEAFKFAENGHVVPAIKFMFLTHRTGGFVDFDSLRPKDGKDYEFIVDLPEMPDLQRPLSVAVGHTPELPHNTIVLRKLDEPLVFADFAPFSNATGKGPPTSGFRPEVTLLEPADGANPRQRQARVRIPLLDLLKAHPETDYYGVLLWMGWPDPDRSQGKKVKKVTVTFTNLRKGVIDHDTFAEEWRFKAGVNGRWHQWEMNSMRNNTNHPLPLPEPITFWLHEDSAVVVSAHGAELDLVDDVYDRPRTIQVSQADVDDEQFPNVSIPPRGAPRGDFPAGRARDVRWHTDVDIRPPAAGKTSNTHSYPVQRAVVRNLFSDLFSTFNDQNDPLGLIDPGYGSPMEETQNPFFIKGKDNTTQEISLLGLETWEKGDTAELLERPRDGAILPEWVDYKLTYTVKVEPQFP